MQKKVYLQPSSRSDKKFMVTVFDDDGRRKTIHFGARGYSDYTKHKTKSRMRRYVSRHRSRENWNKSGIDTAGFWAKWILWDKPSLSDSIRHTEKRFNIDIVQGAPPRNSNAHKSKSHLKSKQKSSKRKSRRKPTRSSSRRKSRRKPTRRSSRRKSRRRSSKRKSRQN